VTIHVRPTAALAERALLPEDPGVAMAIAQALLDKPVMFNHSRGLWGYTGEAADGRPLTVQSTGVGAPSAAVVLEELIRLGLRRAVRVGTCAGLDPTLGLGDLVIAESALAAEGTSLGLLPGTERAAADPELCARLRAAAPELRHGLVASTDRFYAPTGPGRWAGSDGGAGWRAAGALAVELGTAALFGIGARRGVPIACVLTVTDLIGPHEAVEAADVSGADLALSVLACGGGAPGPRAPNVG
jgi:uridine phosphorylase